MNTPRGPSVAELRALLEADALAVAQRYAPPATGSYLDGGEWWTLNPGRADNRVGSFVVHVTGHRRGSWKDFASGEGGDLLDLIRLNLSCDIREAMAEARRYLGLTEDTPEARRTRAEALARAEARRASDAERAEEERQARARYAHSIWLKAQPALRGTPAEAYLRDRRGVDLEAIGRQPGSLRFAPVLNYRHTDMTTGEITEGRYPALVAIVNGPGGAVQGIHRTFLAPVAGSWDKAPVPKPKLTLGPVRGGWINLWRGTGPRGGRGAPLAQAPAGTRVFVTEGIEDGLSVIAAAPHLRVVCAWSLSNMGLIALPDTVSEVTLVADRDDSAGAREALERAIAAHRKAGRRVRLWQPPEGCKDFNDYWRAQAADDSPEAT